MISLYKIKPKFQKLLSPLLRKLKDFGFTPNQITIFAIIVSICLGYSLIFYKDYTFVFIIYSVGLLFRMVLNALDGMMARTYHLQSKKGEVLNELGDIISDIAITLPFILFCKHEPYLIFCFIILTVINEFVGVLAKAIIKDRRYDGPMGKSDRALVLGVFSLVIYFFPQTVFYTEYVFGLSCILILLSTVIRIKHILK